MCSINKLQRFLSVFGNTLLLVLFSTSVTFAVSPISNDPQGFADIKWGAPLHNMKRLSLIDLDGRIQTYQFTNNSFKFADTKVESFRLLSIDGKFARVMIRYQGEETHQAIMQYLTNQYGKVKRRPGSMLRGLTQENTWRGNETEASLNYREHGARGFLMIQSRILAPKFLDLASDHSH